MNSITAKTLFVSNIPFVVWLNKSNICIDRIRLTVNAMFVGSIPNRENYFNILLAVVRRQSAALNFVHSTCNVPNTG